MMRRRSILSLIFSLIFLFAATAPVFTTGSVAYASSPSRIEIEGLTHVAKGKTIELDATVYPRSASQRVIWESSNEKIAKVEGGKVKGLKAGTVKITAYARGYASVKKSVTITVTPKPVKKIKINGPDELDLNGTKTAKLKVSVSPSSAYDKVVWKSSNPKVVKVDSKGKVTALRKGTAKITATAQDGSKVKGELKIKVINSYVPPEPTTPGPDPTDPPAEGKHIALLIGNAQGYPEEYRLKGPYYDIRAMKGMLQGLSQNWQVTMKDNQTCDNMISLIQSVFSGTTEDDVCLFYYSGHGATNETSALVGVDLIGLTAQTLANTLNAACGGKVIVILDSCGSGGTVYSKDGKSRSLNADPSKFVSDMTSAFSYYNKKDREAKVQSLQTGELLDDKYQVLAGCEYMKTSLELSYSDYSFGLMTMGLVNASMGCKFPGGSYTGSMPADTSKDGKVTLSELYTCTKKYVDDIVKQLQKDYPNEDIPNQKIQKSGNANFVFFAH